MTPTIRANQSEPDRAAAAPPTPRRRFQFSLATLLWLTTLIACLVAMCVMYVELRRAREEIRKYRGEMGYLDVSDPNKLYAHGIRTEEMSKWSWRVYVPDKQKYELCMATKGIPIEGLPRSDHRLRLAYSGEILVNAFAGTALDGKWRLAVKVTKRTEFGAAASATECQISPLAGNMIYGGDGVGDDWQDRLNPGSPLILLRGREAKSTQVGPQPCDGVMIWIEEAK
jgi:hypothetical protein